MALAPLHPGRRQSRDVAPGDRTRPVPCVFPSLSARSLSCTARCLLTAAASSQLGRPKGCVVAGHEITNSPTRPPKCPLCSHGCT